jgi:hypothetical protein
MPNSGTSSPWLGLLEVVLLSVQGSLQHELCDWYLYETRVTLVSYPPDTPWYSGAQWAGLLLYKSSSNGAWAALSRAWSRVGIFKSLQRDRDYPRDGPGRPAMIAWAATAHLFCRPHELALALVDSLPWRRRPTLLALERAEIFQMKRRCKFVEASCVFRRSPLLAMARGRRRSGIAWARTTIVTGLEV